MSKSKYLVVTPNGGEACQVAISDTVPANYAYAWRVDLPHAVMRQVERTMRTARIAGPVFGVPADEMGRWINRERRIRQHLGFERRPFDWQAALGWLLIAAGVAGVLFAFFISLGVFFIAGVLAAGLFKR